MGADDADAFRMAIRPACNAMRSIAGKVNRAATFHCRKSCPVIC